MLTNQSSLAPPGHLVDLDVAGAVAQSRQEAGVVSARGLQPASDRRDVVVLPDLSGRADGQPVSCASQAHRLVEPRKCVLRMSPSERSNHQLARLVGADDDRRPESFENCGETCRMHTAER